MTGRECFAVWAPDHAEWSQWAKPVLFALMDRLPAAEPAAPVEPVAVDWAARPDKRQAVILDLPGASAVAAGLTLADRGYRPVPLFNATDGPTPVIDVAQVARQLRDAAPLLATLPLPSDAPPCFLLDSQRMRPPRLPSPGLFDNRWIVFPQDFPSANWLRSRGIEEVVLAMNGRDAPEDDLAHVLLRWQEQGIRILAADVTRADAASEIRVKRPSRFRRAYYRVIAMLGLRRANTGGFGAAIPIAAAGG